MEPVKPPDEPGGMDNIKKERTSPPPPPPALVSYPSLPSMPSSLSQVAEEQQQQQQPTFKPADLPISPAAVTRAPRSLHRTASSSSLKSNATTNLRKKSSMTSLKGTQTPPMSPINLSRRQSSNFPNGATAMPSPKTPLAPAIEEPVAITSEDWARESFENEMRASQEQDSAEETEVVVVLHDACYGHRFSRPHTTKASLSTIVERPERVLAIIRGLSMAYVRLGSRYKEGKHAPNPRRPVPPAPFTIKKSTRSLPLTSPAVTQVHGTEWMKELTSMCDAAETRLALDGKELIRTPGTGPNGRSKPMLHEGDLYLCSESLNAMQGALGGVCDAIDAVFESKRQRRAFACVRPPGHHCSSDYPSGFCWLNNVHVGIAHAIQNHGLTHAAIIDFDLHHGDGSQAIAWAHNSRINCLHKNVGMGKRNPIGYFSLHDINSYPCEDGDIEKVQSASLCIENAHGQTVWNVHLQTWVTEDEFWQHYEKRYLVLIDKMRLFLRSHAEKLNAARKTAHSKITSRAPEVPQPKAAIFISAGFDASEWEGVGMQRHKVNVPTSFYARFTRDVAALADEQGLGVDGRIISVLEGGYSDRALSSGVFSHICGLAASHNEEESTDLADRMAGLSVEADRKLSGPCEKVEESWWSPAHLDEFDQALMSTAAPPPGPKKPKGPNPTYITPTKASVAKSLPPRRSLPASYKPIPPPVEAAPPPRPVTPPPPEPVGWAVAAKELSKVLIPGDRQTTSCRPEDLAPPRQRRQRQSDIGVIRPESSMSVVSNATSEGAAGGKRTGLRERKTKPVYHSDEEDEKPKKSSRPASRANRRRTMGGPKASPKKESSPFEQMQDVPPIPALSLMPLDTSRAMPTPQTQDPEQQPRSAGATMMGPPPLPLQRALSESKVPQQSMPPPHSASADASPTETSHNGFESIDALASGMKRMSIKLNVPTKEEHDKRQRERDFERLRGQFAQQ